MGVSMIEVIFKPMGKKIHIDVPKTLLDIAREAGIALRADCGGIGICGKCIIKISKFDGDISPPTVNELSILGSEPIGQGYRLACQVRIARGSIEVYIPPQSLLQRYRSADVGLEKPLPMNPAIRFLRIIPPRPSLSDPQPDLSRILAELGKKVNAIDVLDIPLDLLKSLPDIVRKSDWDLSVVLWNNKIIDIRSFSETFKPIGVAVDIGTSRVVIHLVDLENGETLAIESMPNPQASYGADIISRLTYAIQSYENLERLRVTIVNAINNLIKRAADRSFIPLDWIYEVIVVGNTVMHHLFLGINPRYLGYSPYTPATGSPHVFKAKELGINVNSNALVYLPPVVAGFVGSDAVADAVAVNLDECTEPCALIDIGTNTEIMINTGSKIVAGSTPAGPAFEGATMAFGMRAVEGAVDQVFIYFDKTLNDYSVRYNVIGTKKPVGICGSGYIDIVANMHRLGLLNKRGKFVKNVKSSRFVYENGLTKFVVVKSDETSIGRDITVDEKDIDNLLLAKAAVASGFKMLLHFAELDAEDLSKIYVAGSFGSYLNVENAINIGLLPKVDTFKYQFVGNASVVGAKAMLKSIEFREKAARIAENTQYIELAAHPEFRKVFMESLYLP